MRRLLSLCNPVYAAALAVKNLAYDRKWLRIRRLEWPVVSIGNLSVGGAGKTPVVMALARLLTANGIQADVLSRGYGRESRTVERVDPAGDAKQFGDEPLLLAQAAGVPVYVGANRYQAGLVAEREVAGPRIHLLDDGFQHRQLARDMDIVLLHRDDFSQSLLPGGNLREPLSALQRASAVILRQEDAHLEEQLRIHCQKKPIWYVKRTLMVPSGMGKVVAFCGIARPDEFFQALRQLQIEIVEAISFSDHHGYTEQDIRRLVQSISSARGSVFLTTEKDFVRLSRTQQAQLQGVAPVKVARLEAHLQNQEAILSRISQLLLGPWS